MPRERLVVVSAVSLLALLLIIPTSGHTESLKVGDVEIDPKDFSPHRPREERTAPCLACHGKNAGGDVDFGPNTNFGTPALRGMSNDYLRQSLVAYKSGKRSGKEMGAIAAMLDAETIDFMAETFAAYPTPPFKSDQELAVLTSQDALFQRGQAIASRGVSDKGVPACNICHGALGEGNADLGPRLAGQVSLYIRQQLTAFAEGTRQTEQAETMQPFATALSAEEIHAVAYYYQNLVNADSVAD